MGEQIEEFVFVSTALEHKTLLPKQVKWNGRIYTCIRSTMQYTTHDGAALIHIFFMTTNEACLQLSFNSTTLLWKLLSIESL